ncbi:MAG: hypothetical protein ABSA75_01695 [Candidatus Bathyarchaeia archaeon]
MPGCVILASVQFTDPDEVKVRPAVVLFEERHKTKLHFHNFKRMANKVIFNLSKDKKQLIFDELIKKLSGLKTQ